MKALFSLPVQGIGLLTELMRGYRNRLKPRPIGLEGLIGWRRVLKLRLTIFVPVPPSAASPLEMSPRVFQINSSRRMRRKPVS
jgi:hypothetical protein